jgi:hypothetical protein
MKLRDLTTAELFPLAYQQDLLKSQSEHFVNNILSDGNVGIAYKDMPINFPSTQDNSPIILYTKPPQLLIGTYLKNNWKPLVAVGIIVLLSATIYNKLKREKEKKMERNQTPKTLYYSLPKKSIKVNRYQ